MRAICIIPSRYGSLRLKGKPLIDICGKPLIQRVYERACSAKRFEEVMVATDDKRIFEAVEAFGGKAVMSPPSLSTGTDRVARVLDDLALDYDIIMNLQGDEPLIDPKDLDRMIECFEQTSDIQMASLMAALDEESDILDANHVKVVVDHNSFALYFSRHPIPYWRKRDRSKLNQNSAKYMVHLGVYAFTLQTLQQFGNWPRSALEISESLEQLRALEHGVRIKMLMAEAPWPGLNTPEDIERVRKEFKKS